MLIMLVLASCKGRKVVVAERSHLESIGIEARRAAMLETTDEEVTIVRWHEDSVGNVSGRDFVTIVRTSKVTKDVSDTIVTAVETKTKTVTTEERTTAEKERKRGAFVPFFTCFFAIFLVYLSKRWTSRH